MFHGSLIILMIIDSSNFYVFLNTSDIRILLPLL